MFRYVSHAVVLSTVLLGSCGAADPPAAIYGNYSLTCPKSDPCKPSADAMKLTSKPDGKIGVDIRLIYAAGHSCHIDGDGQWTDNKIVLEAPGLDEKKPCRLEITMQNGKAALEDVDNRCAPVYCGTRGTFHDVSFTKAAAATKKK